MSVYQRIHGTDWRNIWVTGDLHGCHTLLQQKLHEVSFDTGQDLLLSVGDLIDRGQDNIECLALLKHPWFRAVRGNHEQMLLEHLLHKGGRYPWLINGGDWYPTLNAHNRHRVHTLLPEVVALPLVIEVITQGKKTVLCHADYPASHYVVNKPINEDAVLWSRKRIEASQKGLSLEITGADRFIFGHTPVPAPQIFTNQHYIDTGAVFTGNLTLLQIQ